MRWLWMGIPLLACSGEPEPEPDAPAVEDRVAWAAAEAAEVVPFATLPAHVVPASGARLELGPGVGGRIVAWEVAPGQPVLAGTPLARLVSPELGDLGTRIAEARTRVEERARVVEDRERAERRGIASRSQVTEARSALAEARAALRALQDRLALHSDTVARDGDELVWRSPVSGTVAEVLCPVGLLREDTPCLALARDAGGLLEVSVPERHLATLTGPVTATFTAADGREWRYHELSRAPELDARTRTLRVLLAPATVDGPLVGVSGRARLEVPAAPDLVLIPAAALTRDGAATKVLVRGPASIEVEVLGRSGDRVVVSGLVAGDEVAVEGVFLLRSLEALAEAS